MCAGCVMLVGKAGWWCCPTQPTQNPQITKPTCCVGATKAGVAKKGTQGTRWWGPGVCGVEGKEGGVEAKVGRKLLCRKAGGACGRQGKEGGTCGGGGPGEGKGMLRKPQTRMRERAKRSTAAVRRERSRSRTQAVIGR